MRNQAWIFIDSAVTFEKRVGQTPELRHNRRLFFVMWRLRETAEALLVYPQVRKNLEADGQATVDWVSVF